MTPPRSFLLLLATLSIAKTASGFVLSPLRQPCFVAREMSTGADEETAEASSTKKLLTNPEEMKASLQSIKSQYPTSESDYLAAAKARAVQAKESVNSNASDEDWSQMAKEKIRQMGGETKDEWESSLAEAGSESQAALGGLLIESENDEDKKLLL
eukprot:CAMPEP_0194033842 /NCGR_PEP_ID=MMETSP0009_2-20130614/6356_1 /TAXON_ID=210454 /ORGANISM="Grammatophora oceanica, Strain CCMP 410" /LENGTH=155 /DNA_ID=CAMNT_0038674571 /DNA_START=40 /DNA_END=507 /DNA_ORIENTATION=+